MIATINTDASVMENKGGYAFWIVSDQGKIQKAGKLRGDVSDSHEAETKCIANAIYTLRHSKWVDIHKVIINTDSMNAIEYIKGDRTVRSLVVRSTIRETVFNMMEICIRYGGSIRDIDTFFEFRHVKAHTGKRNARSIVNEWCDKEAKKYARKALHDSKKLKPVNN